MWTFRTVEMVCPCLFVPSCLLGKSPRVGRLTCRPPAHLPARVCPDCLRILSHNLGGTGAHSPCSLPARFCQTLRPAYSYTTTPPPEGPQATPERVTRPL